MIDQAAARETMAGLSTIIAELFEAANPASVAALLGDATAARVEELRALGEDVAILAAAIAVAARRGGLTR